MESFGGGLVARRQDPICGEYKRQGRRPGRGKEHKPKASTYIGSLELGSLSVISLAHLPSPDFLTMAVIDGNIADVVTLRKHYLLWETLLYALSCMLWFAFRGRDLLGHDSYVER